MLFMVTFPLTHRSYRERVSRFLETGRATARGSHVERTLVYSQPQHGLHAGRGRGHQATICVHFPMGRADRLSD